MKGSPAVRLWAKVDKSDANGCWIFTGSKRQRGYGAIGVNGKSVSAHRLAYELEKGAIPLGLEIDHLCRNHSCVRVSHLEAVTHAVNAQRGLAGAHLAAKTNCPKGHPYLGSNLYLYKDGRRACRLCMTYKIRHAGHLVCGRNKCRVSA